ncbi:hypothetical protein M408DRAFT_180498 [Serendipita vermifera MAFF 305830]|uniref:Uncharacterized protein n=1 Tax=Serendipita vermifera MAFF 305830 TaxID=933852 RepID=A0A0C2VZL8_SERVB|nr:hypothetical protein M408DRAFT_180498 [Serendipita vermifera MAFF 305830]
MPYDISRYGLILSTINLRHGVELVQRRMAYYHLVVDGSVCTPRRHCRRSRTNRGSRMDGVCLPRRRFIRWFSSSREAKRRISSVQNPSFPESSHSERLAGRRFRFSRTAAHTSRALLHRACFEHPWLLLSYWRRLPTLGGETQHMDELTHTMNCAFLEILR